MSKNEERRQKLEEKRQKQEKRRQWLLDCMMFVLGRTSKKPEYIENYIDARARKVDLLQWDGNGAAIGSRCRKAKIIESFCYLNNSERAALLEKFPSMITVLPNDCDVLKIKRPPGLAMRHGNFNGKSNYYCVFELKEVLKRYQELPVDVPTKKEMAKARNVDYTS